MDFAHEVPTVLRAIFGRDVRASAPGEGGRLPVLAWVLSEARMSLLEVLDCTVAISFLSGAASRLLALLRDRAHHFSTSRSRLK